MQWSAAKPSCSLGTLSRAADHFGHSNLLACLQRQPCRSAIQHGTPALQSQHVKQAAGGIGPLKAHAALQRHRSKGFVVGPTADHQAGS